MDWSENKKITNSDFIDLWPYLYPEQRGYSWSRRFGYFSFRPDRILFRREDHLNPLSMKIIGTEEVLRPLNKQIPDHDKEYWTISDHFGLVCEFELREEVEIPLKKIQVKQTRNVFIYVGKEDLKEFSARF